MKRFIMIVAMLALLSSCSLLENTETVIGVYLYTGTFISQRLFIDTTNTDLGDTTITSGAILLTWNTVEQITGDNIIISKSVGNNDDYSVLKEIPVVKDGTYTDSILSGNTYYYKFQLDTGNKIREMNEYTIEVPQLTFTAPVITNLTLPDTGFDIAFNDINTGGTYNIDIKDTGGNSVWSTSTTDNSITYDGTALAPGVYIITVSTVIQNLAESQSIVNTTGISQFAIY